MENDAYDIILMVFLLFSVDAKLQLRHDKVSIPRPPSHPEQPRTGGQPHPYELYDFEGSGEEPLLETLDFSSMKSEHV